MKNKFILILVSVNLLFISCKSDNSKTKIMTKNENPVGYFEIPVLNLDRSIAFYHKVFGFEFEKDTVDGNEMAFFPQNENLSGISGALSKGETYVPSKTGTLVYFNTKNIDETLANVGLTGGKTLYPKTKIGDIGFVAEFEDSEGNRVALHQNK